MSGDGEKARQQFPEEKPEGKPEKTKVMPEVPKATPEAPKSGELTDVALASVSGGVESQSKVMAKSHEMKKAIIGNLPR